MVITFYMRSRLWPFKKAENPDVRTTDDHFLMEVAVNNNESELVSFFESTGAVEVKVIEKRDFPMKSLYKISLLVCMAIFVSSCHNNAKPNYQYMPNMYEAVSYETYRRLMLSKMVKNFRLKEQSAEDMMFMNILNLRRFRSCKSRFEITTRLNFGSWKKEKHSLTFTVRYVTEQLEMEKESWLLKVNS